MSLEVAGLRATAHPTRLQILSLLTGTQLSAAEVARELAITQANASYHLRVLAAQGLVVEAGRVKIRGGVAKRYRHPWAEASNHESRRAADSLKSLIHAMASELMRRHRQRKAGRPGQFSDAELWVEPQVWQQAFDAVEQASRQLHANAKPPRTAGTLHVNLTAALFEMDGPVRGDAPTVK